MNAYQTDRGKTMQLSLREYLLTLKTSKQISVICDNGLALRALKNQVKRLPAQLFQMVMADGTCYSYFMHTLKCSKEQV